MDNSILIQQFLDNAVETHSESNLKTAICNKLKVFERSLSSSSEFSVGRGTLIINSLSSVKIKKFTATHSLVPPVL